MRACVRECMHACMSVYRLIQVIFVRQELPRIPILVLFEQGATGLIGKIGETGRAGMPGKDVGCLK